jgi:hypothetical protein
VKRSAEPRIHRPRLAWAGLLLGLACAVAAQAGGGPDECGGDDELAAWAERARESRLYRFAVELFGEPVSCNATRSVYEGDERRSLVFEFAGGARYRLATAPPETSGVSLAVPGGFRDEAAARAALEAHCKGIGLDIDWSRPEVRETGERRSTRFWDPESGRNAAAELIHERGRLVRIGMSMAL